MGPQLLDFAPVFAGVAAGHALVRFGVATREHGRFLFVLAFYVCVPALVFGAFAEAELTRGLAVMPLAAAAAVTGGFVAGSLVGRRLALPTQSLAVFVLASMIVNTGFTLPFVEAAYGATGVARLLAFDVVNASLVFTWGYTMAARANPASSEHGIPWRRVLVTPPLYGIAAGLAVNLSGATVPPVVDDIVVTLGTPTLLLLTLAIGMVLVFDPTRLRIGVVAIVTRTVVSALVVTTLVTVFDLDGVDRAVLAAIAVAPIGFNTVTFSALEDLDVPLAVSASSVSLVLSLVLVPLVLLLTP